MEIKEAIQVLKDHNEWRRGEDEILQMTDPKKLGIAIDTVVNEFENLFISGVVSSCVDKDELISDLDDRRAVGVEMNEDMWYFFRKQFAEYLLDKYKLLRK